MASSYEGVVAGKLKLKGRPLDVSGAKKKKKKKARSESEYVAPEVLSQDDLEENAAAGEGQERDSPHARDEEGDEEHQRPAVVEDHRTPAEKRYHEQKAKLEETRLAKEAGKSHRQRVEEFNQYLANLSEHYDIPKVGPG